MPAELASRLQREIQSELEAALSRLRALRGRLEERDLDPDALERDLEGAISDIDATEAALIARASELEDAIRSLSAELELGIADRTRELAETSARLSTVVQQLPDGVLIFDASGELQLANRRAEALLGQPADRLGVAVDAMRALPGGRSSRYWRAASPRRSSASSSIETGRRSWWTSTSCPCEATP